MFPAKPYKLTRLTTGNEPAWTDRFDALCLHCLHPVVHNQQRAEAVNRALDHWCKEHGRGMAYFRVPYTWK